MNLMSSFLWGCTMYNMFLNFCILSVCIQSSSQLYDRKQITPKMRYLWQRFMCAQVSGNFKALWIRGDNLYYKGWRIPLCADADVGRLDVLIGLILMVCRDMCEINGCFCFKHYQQGWTGTQKQPTEFPLNKCFSTGASFKISLVWEKHLELRVLLLLMFLRLHTPDRKVVLSGSWSV